MNTKKPKFYRYILCIGSLILGLSACSLQGTLELVQQLDSKVPEASGLTLHDGHLFVVSDKNGDIYKLNLEGQIVDRLRTKTKDVEGITVMDTLFYIVDEAKQKVRTYDFLSKRIQSFAIEHPKIYNPSSGLEGIVYDKYSDQFLILHEKESGQVLRYTTDMEFIDQIFLGSYSDYSGIATTKEHIWIISDEGAGVAQYDRKYNLIKLYSLGIDSPEGIVIDEEKGLIYVVSDTTGELRVFVLPVK